MIMKNITILVLENNVERRSMIPDVEKCLSSLAKEEDMKIMVRKVDLFSRAYFQVKNSDVELVILHYLFTSPQDDNNTSIRDIIEYGVPVLFVREQHEQYNKRAAAEMFSKRMRKLENFHECIMKEYLSNVQDILRKIIAQRRKLLS